MPRNLKIGFTVLSLTRDGRLGEQLRARDSGVRRLRALVPVHLRGTTAARARVRRHASRDFRVIYTVAAPDPHGFDADHNGVGCES